MIIKGKIVHVLGAGRSGRAAAQLAASRGAIVTLFDSSDEISNIPTNITVHPKATIETGKNSSCELLVISPGIDTFGDYVAAFSEHAGEMIGETELGYRFYDGKITAITGTNGKTTTTELVQRIMSENGISCVACGNYGIPLSEVVMLDEVPDSIALELSSFQLETIKDFKPDVAIWLNFDADHMDRYTCIQDYKNAKLRIFENQTELDFSIIREGEDVGGIKAKKLTFSTESQNSDFTLIDNNICFQGKPLLDLSHTRLRGLHNAENAMAAIGACLKMGVAEEMIAPALAGFAPPMHRCELIRTLDGVEYLNDSKATNLHALDSALRSQSRPVVLIAGGKEKGLDYKDLLPRLKLHVHHAIVFGEISDQLKKLFSQVVETHLVATLTEAVQLSTKLAKHGDAVLLSPGTSSFDQFKGYEHRGDVFREAVLKLK
ncbi:MAG: UDP-N-acetylmuramoylalanine--D-glutamate ligase [Cryomorphaceae bacterium]|jgi:UDP-N-acetylmuramoylalanine--D-glutamate ligase